MSFYHLSKNWKVNVKNIIGVLSLLLLILILPKTGSAVTIERVKPTNTSVQLKLGKKTEFKVKGEGSGIANPIDKIVFSVSSVDDLNPITEEEYPQVDGKEEDTCATFCASHVHKVKYTWNTVGSYIVTATVHSKNQQYAPATLTWTVNVAIPPPEITKVVPNLKYVKESEGTDILSGADYLVLNSVETWQTQEGVDTTFKITAKSDDKIRYIEFNSHGTDADRKGWGASLLNPSRTHSTKYSWDIGGKKTVTATIETKAGGRAEFTWNIFVVQGNRAPTLKKNKAPIRLPTMTVGNLAHALDMSEYFSDPNDDILTYNVEIGQNSGVIDLQLHKTSSNRIEILPVSPWQESDYRLAIIPKKAGSATFTVTASDGEYSVAQTFSVVVETSPTPVANQAPGLINSISTQTLRMGDSSTTIDVSGYFRDPDGDALTYTVTSSDANVVSAQRTGTASISISPTGEGSAQVTVTASDSQLTATQTFNVTVSAQLIVTNPPRAVGTIPSKTLTEDGSATTVDVSQYFSSSNNLTYEAASNPSGIVKTSVSGSRVTITPVSGGVVTVVVTARDTVNTDLTAIQTISVVVSQTSAVIVRPPTNTDPTFNVPDRSNPRAEGLREGVSVIVDGLAQGNTLRVRSGPGTNNAIIDLVGNGATGIIEDGPRSANGFTWWKIDWDRANIEGWSAEAVGGDQLLFRQPPDLKIRDFDVSDDEVNLGQEFELEVEIRNNGPGESAATNVYFYYHSGSRNDNLEELAVERGLRSAGSLRVPSLQERRSTTLTLSVDAPTTPDRYYYGALLRSNIHNTDNTDHLDEHALRNNLADEERVEVTGSPDYLVESISVSSPTLDPGQEFTLRTTVRNQGLGEPTSSTRLTYYLSSDARISSSDKKVGDDFVSSLDTNETDNESIRLTAPTEPGVYYYGACVSRVTNESNSNNNCSAAAAITVRPNYAPVAVGSISAQTLNIGDSPLQIDVSSNFRDPDNDALTYTATSNNGHIATVTVSGSQVRITPVSEGIATITVTASDGELTAMQTVSVSVVKRNRAPVAVGTIFQQAFTVGDSASVLDVSSNFQDPDGDTLTYSTSSSNSSVADASVSGSQVTITPVSEGETTITVTASDGEFTATQTISVSVGSLNQAPIAVGTISDHTLRIGDASVQIDVSGNFTDPENDTLTYTAYSNNRSIATASIFGSQLEITPISHGTTTITIEASDGEFYATQTVYITITDASIANRAPVTVGTISARTLTVGDSAVVLDVSDNFQDPDENTLTYSTSSDNNSVATVNAVGSQITITPIGIGSATITITASDGEFTATQTISISVNAAFSGLDWMPDANLRTKVRAVLGLQEGEKLTQQALKGLTELSARDSAIRDISGLEYATQLTSLDLGNNSISDITPLKDLTKLRQLSIDGNNISNIQPLAGLTSLENLSAGINPIDDILPLQSLLKLTGLFIDSIQFGGDITPLKDFTNLTSLDLANNNISDVSALGSLTSLQYRTYAVLNFIEGFES